MRAASAVHVKVMQPRASRLHELHCRREDQEHESSLLRDRAATLARTQAEIKLQEIVPVQAVHRNRCYSATAVTLCFAPPALIAATGEDADRSRRRHFSQKLTRQRTSTKLRGIHRGGVLGRLARAQQREEHVKP